MDKEDRACLSNLKLFERLVILESTFKANTEKDKQALELAKRLEDIKFEDLNRLRKEVVSDRDQFLKKEIYDVKTAWYDEWCRGVDRKLAYWAGAIVMLVFVINFLFRMIGK